MQNELRPLENSRHLIDLIPQRAPFRFIDEVLSWDDKKLQSFYLVKGQEDFFKGHFPDLPIMPGVLLQEAIFQSAALHMALQSIQKEEEANQIGVVVKVENARFRQLVRPLDELIISVELVNQELNAFVYKGMIKVLNKVVASAQFTCAQIERPQDPQIQ